MAQVIAADEVVTVKSGAITIQGVSATALTDGGYAVTWFENIAGTTVVQTARFEADDDAVDLDPGTLGNFRILNPPASLGSTGPLNIAATANGGFVVGFHDNTTKYSVANFDAGGFFRLDVMPHDPSGVNFYISYGIDVAGLAGGGYVATYRGEYSLNNIEITVADTFDSGIGGFEANFVASHAVLGALGMGYVLAYSGTEGGNGFVKARIISDTVAPVDIVVNQTAAPGTRLDGNATTNITQLSNGNFVIIWGNGSNKVFARVFEPDGDAVTDEIWVDGNTTIDWPISVVAVDNGFAVLWTGFNAGIQVFDNAGSKVGDVFYEFSDGNGDNGVIRGMTVLESGELMVSYAGGTSGFASVQKLTIAPIVGEEEPPPPPSFTTITGTTKADKIDASHSPSGQPKPGADAEVINALAGKDTVKALGGKDTVDGGKGIDKIDGGLGDDVLKGGAGNDKIVGGKGDDLLAGGAGKDALNGGAGSDTADYSDRSKAVEVTLNKGKTVVVEVGGKAEDTIKAVENVIGSSKADKLTGDGASNTLYGRGGKDTLDGKGGKDFFVFDTALAKSNVDTIIGFKPKDDTLRLDDVIFTSLGFGPLSADAFKANKSGQATDDSDRIVYEKDTGKLFYDADGNGAGARMLFAVLSGNPKLTVADFEIA